MQLTPLRAILCTVAVACGGESVRPAPAPRPSAGPAVQLVESFPIETSLDQPDIPQAYDVWLEMFDSARRSIDLAEFYASNKDGSRLEPIVAAIERAAGRGVRVRFLADAGFADTYPETLERLGNLDGITIRHTEHHHAKYFIVDGVEAYIGSQNFDWRSLEHIQELGVRIRDRPVIDALADVFATDWTGEPPPARDYGFAGGLRMAASPKSRLPDPKLWDLPQLVTRIDTAQRSIHVQLLSYRRYEPLEDALERAAGRGVSVQIMVADWSKSPPKIDDIKALQKTPGIDVKLVTIPQWSGGFIPFARVIHAKYMVVDGARYWVGTSNWSASYFESSRNVGILGREPEIAEALERLFATGWNSDYAELCDPDRDYEPPRVE